LEVKFACIQPVPEEDEYFARIVGVVVLPPLWTCKFELVSQLILEFYGALFAVKVEPE